MTIFKVFVAVGRTCQNMRIYLVDMLTMNNVPTAEYGAQQFATGPIFRFITLC